MADLKEQAQEWSIPGLTSKSSGIDFKKYAVKYYKANLDEPIDILELQNIETRGIRGEDVLILNRDKMSFMDKYFLIVQYLEKID
jgi:hypothetical protein